MPGPPGEDPGRRRIEHSQSQREEPREKTRCYIKISRYPYVPVNIYLTSFKALADETRLRIVAILRSGAFNVNELVRILGMGQSRVSRHLKILSDAELVDARRDGVWVYYRLSELWKGRGSLRGRPHLRYLRVLARELPRGRDRQAIQGCLRARRERASRFFKGVAPEWDRQRDRVQGRPQHLDDLARDLGRAGTVVDLGTGTGVLLSRLSPRARHVIGVDASSEMLDVARRNVEADGLANVELRLGTLEHLPLADHQADAMVANMVLHHVANPAEVLREVRRGLKPGGLFLLADLAPHAEESYREELGALWLGFERREIEGWLEEADLELTDFREIPHPEGGPAVIVVTARAREEAMAATLHGVRNEV